MIDNRHQQQVKSWKWFYDSMELLIFQIQDYFLVFSGLSLKVNIKQFEEYLIEEDSEKSEK